MMEYQQRLQKIMELLMNMIMVFVFWIFNLIKKSFFKYMCVFYNIRNKTEIIENQLMN